ncbi:MAG: Na+/H+ antiporter subunit E [Candidatus Cloacimonetes bacterium]|jgi:multicomponent Na+:H+ antiporter subunit E|nr:Na+/H+ antiporter subunit E [Candidatus Cloacimonadota bacterium]MBT4332518.1 Na+/H+ antiporter subunit E [Candidatus Cloacimonadota bacterium]MBT4575230.1 Na+/H+ antiporter subunit E [Candidatus Cloacimonadota bacterium]MBT5420833.1 Na+/H+ antiporter subunit E [Candidatus Cloacimonadota bacterium]
MKKGFLFFISLLIVWTLLAGTDQQEIIIGAIVSLLLTIIFFSKATIFSEFNLNPKAIFYFFTYIFVFSWELLKSNLDVAFRVIHPTIPINPGIVKVKTKLKSKLGRTILANSITLTPGTLTVETNGEDYYIHWIDVTSDDIEGATKQIVSKFEKYLEVIFG